MLLFLSHSVLQIFVLQFDGLLQTSQLKMGKFSFEVYELLNVTLVLNYVTIYYKNSIFNTTSLKLFKFIHCSCNLEKSF